tara:strand:+ start:13250 stop:14746 length:1497 start_codon:yes stop_codon:yes gene_type:complete
MTQQITSSIVTVSGGLILDQDVYSMPPGAASILNNFEPSILGGYRRLEGTSKYSSSQVNGSNTVQGVFVYNDQVFAISNGTLARSAGSSWTNLETGLNASGRYMGERFNYENTEKLILVNGADNPRVLTGNTVATITASGVPTDAQHVASFRSHMFYAGMSSNPQEIVFSAPFNEDDFQASNGAGSIKVDDNVTGLKVFRDNLFIFCQDRIFKLTGSGLASFAIENISRHIGCLDGFSIQEIGGDLAFLGPDGIRTVQGTARIGDIELGSISKPIQRRFEDVILDRISSVVIREKSQYRLFTPSTNGIEKAAKGIIGVIKATPQGGIGWEWADLKGIKPSCCDSYYISNDEVVVHGGYDGYVYQQESGNTFAGTNIRASYRSPDLTLGDAGIRKNMQRINVNYDSEGEVDLMLGVKFDFENADIPQPANYNLTTQVSHALYGGTTYGSGVYGSEGFPIVRQPIEGSGFTAVVKIDDTSSNPPITLKGFQLEFTPGTRM